jgi:hypothetical protein
MDMGIHAAIVISTHKIKAVATEQEQRHRIEAEGNLKATSNTVG